MIRAAVKRVAVGNTTYWYKDDHGVSRSVKIARAATAEEFLAANSGCCRIVLGGGDVRRPSFVNRVLGEISAVVEVDHVQRRPDSQGGLHAHDIRDYLYISPCGRAYFD